MRIDTRKLRSAIGRRKLTLIVVGAVLSLIAYHLYLSISIERIRDRLRAEGYPATQDEIAAWGALPEGEANAAEAYEAAHKLFPDYEHYDEYDWLPYVANAEGNKFSLHRAYPQKVIDDMGRYIAANAELFEALHAAGQMEFGHLVRETGELYSDYESREMSHLSRRRQMAQHFAMEALYWSSVTNTMKAIDAIESGFSLGRPSNPSTIAVLVGTSMDGIARTCVMQLLNRSNPDDQQLVRLSKVIRDNMSDARLAAAFASDQAYPDIAEYGLHMYDQEEPALLMFGVDDVDRVYAGVERGVRKSLGGLREVLHRVFAVHERQQREACLVSERAAEVALLPTKQALDRYDELQERYGPRGPLLEYSQYKSIKAMQGRAIADLRCLHTVIAIERYRLSHGSPPATLDDLVPEFLVSVPLDPFDERPIRYRLDEKGYVVYSVGKELEDDGGYDFDNPPRGPCCGAFVVFF